MTDYGLDYSFGRPDLDAAWAAGYRFVCRYLSWDNPATHGKIIDAVELAALRARGFQVALNWEYDARDELGGAQAGTVQAVEAVRQAQALNYPRGCTIYFSADFDETGAQVPAVDDYARAAGAVVRAAGYRMGAYGGIAAIGQLLDAGLIDDAWQTYAWSGGRWDPRAAIRQDQNGILVGGSSDCDHNTRTGRTYLMGQAAAPTTVEGCNMGAIVQDIDGTYYVLGGDGVARPLVIPAGSTINDVGFVASGKYRPGGVTGPARPGVLCSNAVIDAEPHIDIPVIPVALIAVAPPAPPISIPTAPPVIGPVTLHVTGGALNLAAQ